MKIEVTDNNIGQKDKDIYDRKAIAALFPIAGKKIEDLCKANPRLLLFPHSLKESEDLDSQKLVFTIDSTESSEKVRITTGNVMGFIGIKDVRLKIKSRFDNGRDDFFLHYMLRRVLSLNLFDLKHNNDQEDIFDFLIYMFPCLLGKALSQGVYKEYRRFQHNDADIKGTVNVGRHIVHNMPFVGNFAYSTREYAHDNNVTQLIRHTIEFIKTKEMGQFVLSKDKDTIDNVNSIIACTSSYCQSQRSAIISKNLRFKSHPYYTKYQLLQSLCLQILRHDEVKYGENDDDICGILFDGAWLWEEYVNTVLKKKGFKHPENKNRRGGIYLLEEGNRKCYPDFYNDKIVLDAKYKRLDSCSNLSKVGREDLYQLITYTTRLQVAKGGFIAPLQEKQQDVPKARVKNAATTLYIFGIEISKSAVSFDDFCKEMKKHELAFLKTLEID